MAKGRVGVLEFHEAPGPGVQAATCCGRAIADYLVRYRHARVIGKRLIQMVSGKAKDAIKHAKTVRDAAAKRAKEVMAGLGLCDGPKGRGNILPFAKKSHGEKLHYETAMAGDGNWIDGYTPRRRIFVSARPRFNEQLLSPVSVRVNA